ncbi:MAG: hypothetical protein QOH32_4445, partial [Bradyrhizobium sp.]|nr:hypothetical protein [Bradyrhizobium sp.]
THGVQIGAISGSCGRFRTGERRWFVIRITFRRCFFREPAGTGFRRTGWYRHRTGLGPGARTCDDPANPAVAFLKCRNGVAFGAGRNHAQGLAPGIARHALRRRPVDGSPRASGPTFLAARALRIGIQLPELTVATLRRSASLAAGPAWRRSHDCSRQSIRVIGTAPRRLASWIWNTKSVCGATFRSSQRSNWFRDLLADDHNNAESRAKLRWRKADNSGPPDSWSCVICALSFAA